MSDAPTRPLPPSPEGDGPGGDGPGGDGFGRGGDGFGGGGDGFGGGGDGFDGGPGGPGGDGPNGDEPEKPWWQQWWAIGGLVVVILAIIAALALGGGDDDPDEVSTATPTPTETSPETATATELTPTASATDGQTPGPATPTDTTTTPGEATASPTAAACTPESMELYEPGILTAATGEPVFEPWMVDDDPSNEQGYESAFVYAMAKELGFAPDDVTWVRTGFDEAIAPGEKPYDFNIQQYTIQEDRDEVVDFSVPYYIAQRAVVAVEGSPADGATTFDKLREATWGATQGTFDLDYIENEIGVADVAVYNSQVDTLAAMNAGQIDATVVNLPTAYFLTATQVDDAVIAGILPTDEANADKFGLLLTEGSPLKPCFDEAITTLDDNGTLDELATTWLAAEGDIPSITQ